MKSRIYFIGQRLPANQNKKGQTMPQPDLVDVLRGTVVALVADERRDLSARQLGVLLTVYLDEARGHTVRGLAADLKVSKPAITRALDRLGEFDLARRKVDPLDRRSVLVQRTPKGAAFLRDLNKIMAKAAKDVASAERSKKVA
jgi:DNA-binding MarR family transcriptional regulator